MSDSIKERPPVPEKVLAAIRDAWPNQADGIIKELRYHSGDHFWSFNRWGMFVGGGRGWVHTHMNIDEFSHRLTALIAEAEMTANEEQREGIVSILAFCACYCSMEIRMEECDFVQRVCAIWQNTRLEQFPGQLEVEYK